MGLKPTYIHDNIGVCFTLATCGRVTGCLYLINELDESKKCLGKCILANIIPLLNLKHRVEYLKKGKW